MVPTLLFLFFFSVINISLNASTNDEDDTETPALRDDIAIPDTIGRNAAPCTAKGCKWPKSGRHVFVPYSLSPGYSKRQQNIIIRCMTSFHKNTCIRFVPRESHHRNYIRFFSGTGCWSYVGYQKGEQRISLEKPGCLECSTVQHEILHALGFEHEHVRSDRDKYIWILFENIKPEDRVNFNKIKTNNLGTPYDFNSVMEYANKDFSKNGKPTIVAKRNPNLVFGHATKMSANDIKRVNRLYKC